MTVDGVRKIIESIDDTSTSLSGPSSVTFLPEPERSARRYTIISVDDHLVEPPTMFEGRIPVNLQEVAPRVVEAENGSQYWLYDGQKVPNVGFNALIGRPVSEYGSDPLRFDQMRRGAWDIEYRIKDMDLNGVLASINFPSHLPGFAGQRLQLKHDPALALATVRAWNSFCLEEWTGAHPDRIIPIQLPWLLDPDLAAEEIRSNAQLGFKAVSFSEGPHALGLPSIHSGYWDPFFAACEETGTVVCVHTGSSGTIPSGPPDAPPESTFALCLMNAAVALDWLYSKVPVRFPNLKILLAECGAGWAAPMLDRLDHMYIYNDLFETWRNEELRPSEVFQRNFYLCAIDEPSAMLVRERIGIDHITVESDYPHIDSSWPHTQATLNRMLDGLPDEDVAMITWKNASKLFRHDVDAVVQADPDAY